MVGERQPKDQPEASGAGAAPTPADGSAVSAEPAGFADPLEAVALDGRDGGDGGGSDGSNGSDGSHACFSSLDVTRVRRALAKLHEQVTYSRGRVEIKRRGCDDVCVMISKAELEALESALEIMSGSKEYKSMCEMLSQVAAAAGGYAAARH